jgi:hypothetical protein
LNCRSTFFASDSVEQVTVTLFFVRMTFNSLPTSTKESTATKAIQKLSSLSWLLAHQNSSSGETFPDFSHVCIDSFFIKLHLVSRQLRHWNPLITC